MFNKIAINNFKCFIDETINFRGLTVLAGANGVGKSSVIQSLLLIRKFYQSQVPSDTEAFISINDKVNSFLELGSTKEIRNSELGKSTIAFNVYEDDEQYDLITFEIERNNELSLKGTYEYKNTSSEFPLKNYLHYLNAERLGPRNTQEVTVQKDLNVGFQGEYTGQAIALASKQIETIDEARKVDTSTETTFASQVQAWVQFIIPEIEIRIETFDKINQVRIGIRKRGSDTDFLHPNNIGFGISYSLPIIACCLLASKNSIIIIENPEAHLHPLGQSKMGQFLAKMAGAGLQIIIETHSEHVINGIRIGSLKKYIDHQDILINFFTQTRKVNVQEIQVNHKAELDDWPVGFFDQEERDISQIFKYTRKPN